MPSPVWVLSVDLQAKTATFTTGLAQAAQNARGAFRDIKSGTDDMAQGFIASGNNVRAALGLIDNTIRGNHAAAMADLIREFKDSALVMSALPFAVTIGGIAAIAGIAIEVAAKIKEWREEQERLTQEQTKFGTTGQEVFNALDEKIIEAEKRSDELRNDHLGALQKQLELIDKQSFSEILQNFETLAKGADEVFKALQGNWYTFGIGSAGAQHALQQFQTQYESLLAQGKGSEASDLLKGTRDSAQRVLDAQKQYNNSRTGGGLLGPTVDYSAQYQALNVLKAAGVGTTEKEVAAQQALVDTLNRQLGVQDRISKLKSLEGDNAKQTNTNDSARKSSAGAQEAAASQLRMGEMVVAADKATADARLEVQHASIAERLANDIEFADRELAVQLAGNQAEIAALNKLSDDYPNQLKALQDKTLELQQQHTSRIAELTAQASVQQAAQDLQRTEESEREKIDATEKGSRARLAAIDAALKEEATLNLQSMDSYRALETQRVETAREMAQQEAEAKLQAVQAQTRVEEQSLQAQFRLAQQELTARSGTAAQQAQLAVEEENKLYQLELQGLQKELAALQASGEAKVQEASRVQREIESLTQTHENKVGEIQAQAAQKQKQEQTQTLVTMETQLGQSLLSMLSGHRSFAQEMSSIGTSLANNMMTAAVQEINGLNAPKMAQAESAARSTYTEVAKLPVIGPFLAPELAAGAFAAVMAFEKGGIVPGVGKGDTVPAMLSPGEGVVPGGVMDGLSKIARNGGFNGGGAQTTHIHVHYRPTVHAIDGPSVEGMLKKHGQVFAKHFHSEVRKMNR